MRFKLQTLCVRRIFKSFRAERCFEVFNVMRCIVMICTYLASALPKPGQSLIITEGFCHCLHLTESTQRTNGIICLPAKIILDMMLLLYNKMNNDMDILCLLPIIKSKADISFVYYVFGFYPNMCDPSIWKILET